MGSPAANAQIGNAAAPEAQGAAEGAPQGPDFSPVIDRLDQFESQMGPVVEFVESQRQAATQQGAPAEQSYEDFVAALFAGDQGQQQGGVVQQQAQQQQQPQYDPFGNPIQPQQQQQPGQLPQVFQDPQSFMQLLDRALDRRMADTVTPELQSLRAERQERDVNGLMERYPKLQEREAAQEVATAAQQFSHELAQRLGLPPEAADQMWRQPGVIETMYLAQQARERSSAEVPADASAGEAQLEGGGSHPGQQQQQGSLKDQIIQAHNGSGSGFRFW